MKHEIHKFLKEKGACSEAVEWSKDKTWKEIYNTCDRGDWLLWLFSYSNSNDLQKLTLAKAHCANTVRHLMKDERSKTAIDVAIKFSKGKATLKELNAATHAAYIAFNVAYTVGINIYFCASYAAYAAASYACAASAAAYTDYTASYPKGEYQSKTADLCRKYLPFEIWNIK